MSITQYIEDTKYMQWEDGMYVMLEDLPCDYEKALVEDSLRRSVYFVRESYFRNMGRRAAALGVSRNDAGRWRVHWALKTEITRAQALYIATKKTET
jgi:hypothetical protein